MYANPENLAEEWTKYRNLYTEDPEKNAHAIFVCMALLRVSQDLLDLKDYIKLLELTEVNHD